MYIGLHVQYMYIHRSSCTVHVHISVFTYSTCTYIGLHVQYMYIYRSSHTVHVHISVFTYSICTYIGLHVQYMYIYRSSRTVHVHISVFTYSTCYFCQILMKLEFPQQIFTKYSNNKFNENSSSGSRVILWGRTDMTKLTFTFHNFVNMPKNQ